MQEGVTSGFAATSVVQACGQHDQREYEPVRTLDDGGQHEHEQQAEGSEDATEQVEQRRHALQRRSTDDGRRGELMIAEPAR
jgi:hypothetical protein